MSDYLVITVLITLEAANDPVYEPTPPDPCADQLRCELWVTCENPRCFQHGCLNIASKSAKGVRHV
jgi:hypothetical protein